MFGDPAGSRKEYVLRNRRRLGISLLELMITIVLLTTVLITFAAVYPSGYRLNRKSARHTVAAQTAQAVAEELQNLNVFSNTDLELSLAYMEENPWVEDSPDPLYANFPKTPIPEGFTLKTIDVQTYAVSGDVPSFANIEVTVSYRDQRTRGDEDINVTVTAAKTDNVR